MKKFIIKIDNILDKIMSSQLILWIMIIFASFAFGILCFGKTIWLDEAITGTFIRLPFWQMIRTTAGDVHPPLYYIIVKSAILLFGDHIWVVKLFSYIPFMMTLILVACKVSKMFGNTVAFILSVLLCITPCIICKHAEMRMYPWALFFVLTFAVYLYSAVNENRKIEWVIAVFVGICAAYTHYYALIGIAIFYILFFMLTIKKHEIRRKLYVSVLTSSILYAPWLWVLLQQTKTISETGWWNEANLSLYNIIVGYVAWPFSEKTGIAQYLFLIILILCIVYSIRIIEDKEKKFIYCCIGTYIIVILSGVLITILFTPVFIARFLYPCVGILLLGISIILAKGDKKLLFFIMLLF